MKRALLFVALVVALLPPLASYSSATALSGTPPSGALLQDSATHSVYLPIVMNMTPPVIPPTTKVVEQTALQDLAAVSPNGETFTFTDPSPVLGSLTPGDVMVGSTAAAAPNGFLRRVQSASQQNGNVVVQTTDATLEDAIMDGSVSISQNLTPDEAQTAQVEPGVNFARPAAALSTEFDLTIDNVVLYDNDGNLTTKEDQIRADGNIKLQPAFDFELSVKGGQLRNLSIQQRVTQTAKLEIYSTIKSFSDGV